MTERARPYRYRLYGLAVESSRPIGLADRPHFDGTPHLRVDWGVGSPVDSDWRPPRPPRAGGPAYPQTSLAAAGGEWLTRVGYYRDDRAFLMVNRAADRILIVHTECMPPRDLASLFVGPMLGAAMRLRGDLVLHASVVAIGDRAVAFVGPSRSGKSTHAAALLRRGHRILADDIARLTATPGGFDVHAGYSMLRVRPGTAELVAPRYESELEPVYTFRDSFYAPLGEAFDSRALPLAAIYLLEPGSGVTAVDAAEAVPRLSRNLFADYVARADGWPSEFERLCRLALAVPAKTWRISTRRSAPSSPMPNASAAEEPGGA